MRYASFLIGAVLLLAINVNAQINVVNPPSSDAFPQVALLTPSANPFGFGALPAAAPAGITGISATGAPLAEPPQQVQSVYETYNWQAYIGYEYLRYYQVPAVTLNTNGFTYSMVYYIKNWVGADGEFDATHLNEFNTGGWLLLGMGGARFRWSAPRGLELWAHVLGGYSHFTPQTAFGNEHAPAYEAGGGVDIRFRPRFAWRAEADMVGTHYFNTYQYSPKVTLGLVIKF
jgi:hypothetical protein